MLTVKPTPTLVTGTASDFPAQQSGPIAGDPKTQALMREAQLLAQSNATVLILGESGVGKEVFARLIHQRSPRSKKPFGAISAAAIPDNLLEAELFGYEKGAFSGADRSKPGRLEAVDGGTFLLDEIAELPITLQTKLLRVLQERQVDRIGALNPRPINVRIIATTHRDLSRMVADGRFRADLYYRLNVLRLAIPPLCQRPGDIIPLAESFLTASCKALGRSRATLSESACARLIQHPWPGNVRELSAVIERAATLVPGASINAQDLRIDDGLETAAPLAGTLAEVEKRVILQTLDAVEGNREEAARRLGVTSRTLRNKLKAWASLGAPPSPVMERHHV